MALNAFRIIILCRYGWFDQTSRQGLKLKVTRGPDEPSSKISQAVLKMKFF